MNNIITKSSFLQISNCKFIVNNNIYQLRNIFCLEISGGGGLRPSLNLSGGANVPRPPCIHPWLEEFTGEHGELNEYAWRIKET